MSIGIDWLAEDAGESDKIWKTNGPIIVKVEGGVRGLEGTNKSEEIWEVDEAALVDIGTQKEGRVNNIDNQ